MELNKHQPWVFRQEWIWRPGIDHWFPRWGNLQRFIFYVFTGLVVKMINIVNSVKMLTILLLTFVGPEFSPGVYILGRIHFGREKYDDSSLLDTFWESNHFSSQTLFCDSRGSQLTFMTQLGKDMYDNSSVLDTAWESDHFSPQTHICRHWRGSQLTF